MAQDPQLEKILAERKREVHARNMNPPAGAASPVTLRALETLRKLAPHKVVGIMPKEDFDHPDAFTNVLASVRLKNRTDVNVNPGFAMMHPEAKIAHTLGHEAEHIWQARNAEPDYFRNAINEFRLPYEERPSEIEARKAADSYNFDWWKWAPGDEQRADIVNPVVKGLFDSRKKRKGEK